MSDKTHLRLDAGHWEQRYLDESIPWDTGEADHHLQRFLTDFGLSPCGTLDIGCGTGTNAIWLQGRGFEVTGIDVSATAIARSQARAREAQQDCSFEVADLRSDDIHSAPFQFAYDRGCFHIFSDPSDSTHFARRISEHLDDDGLWCSVLGSTDGPPRDTGPPRLSAAAISAAVEPHFEILELKSCLFDKGVNSATRGWVMVARKRGS